MNLLTYHSVTNHFTYRYRTGTYVSHKSSLQVVGISYRYRVPYIPYLTVLIYLFIAGLSGREQPNLDDCLRQSQ
jgi:hypothetical protein